MISLYNITYHFVRDKAIFVVYFLNYFLIYIFIILFYIYNY